MFQLAEIIGVMVCDIEERMPPDELVYWLAYYELKDAKIKHDTKVNDAQNKAVVSKKYN